VLFFYSKKRCTVSVGGEDWPRFSLAEVLCTVRGFNKDCPASVVSALYCLWLQEGLHPASAVSAVWLVLCTVRGFSKDCPASVVSALYCSWLQ
jgi:hypothetical protein